MDTVHDTTVCVVGGGPAGAMLGLLLARSGIDVVVLEKHGDFLRDFRGDTVHPSTLEVLDEIGLAEEFLKLPHHKMRTVELVEGGQRRTMLDHRLLNERYSYVAYVPQWDFLNFITSEAARHPHFTLLMNAPVEDIVRADGRVAGVRYRDANGEPREIRAHLTVAADGRHSAVRRAAGLTPRDLGSSIDVVMFALPREDDDPDDAFTMWMGHGGFVGVINRKTYWHMMYVIHKGGAQALRSGGIGALHDAVSDLVPFVADRVRAQIKAFDDVNVLEVTVNRLRRWHRPGLLFIGDAAHAMSPLYGVGVNLAVQDAVATSNLLTDHLRRWQEHAVPVPMRAMRAIQRRRVLPTITTQIIQRLVQWSGIDQALRHPEREAPSVFARVPQNRTMTRMMTKLSATGILPEHVHTSAAPRSDQR